MVGRLHTTSQKRRARHLRIHSSQEKSCIFYANNLTIAKCTQPTSHTSNTVDKLNKSKLSGLVNIYTMVQQLVFWWWCCCCLFLRKSTTVSSTKVVAAAAVVAAVAAVDDDWRQKAAGIESVDGRMIACNDECERRKTTQQPNNEGISKSGRWWVATMATQRRL